MTREIISNLPMETDFTTDWVKATIRDYRTKDKYAVANVQVVWTGVSANPDATIRIEITNDLLYKTKSAVHNVSNTNNSDDALMISMDGGFRFFRFVYTANSVLTGRLTIIANYE
jgi:hypothetical protein